MPVDIEEWKRANPYVLVNTKSIGTLYGRYKELEDAKRAIALRGAEFVGVSGTQVFFSEPVFV